MKERQPESLTPKELLHEQILNILEENDALCMDVKEEREKLADFLTESVWEGEWRIPGLEDEDFGFWQEP